MKYVPSLLVAVAALGAILLLIREPVLLATGDYLVVQDELRPADVIHVISGPDDRTDHAIQLYKEGYGDRIFFTGGWCRFHNYYHGQHGRQRALGQGVPSEAIAIDESPVTSTYSEAARLREFVARSQVSIHGVIIVSDPHHMRRARWTYRRLVGNEVTIQMAPIPFEVSPYQRRWWADEATRKYVRDEYGKTIYYIARYQFGWGPLGEWLASLDPEG
jgi:uncharacterized SAM-binding protein YcdF (DUF218 family)